MAKANPLALKIEPVSVIAKTFTDDPKFKYTCACGQQYNGDTCPKATSDEPHDTRTENAPNLEFSINFRKPRNLDRLAIVSLCQEMSAKYVTGYGVSGSKNYVAPDLLIGGFGTPVKLSMRACNTVAALKTCQMAASADDLYTFEELAQFMISESICEQMYVCGESLLNEDDDSPLAS